MNSHPIILGIESTCDETAAAIVQNRKVLANQVSSSMEEYARYGGIIPEIASRAHLEAIGPVLENAFAEANLTPNDIDCIAVAAGPGLMASLSVGVSAAKGLALASNKPIYGVNHIIAHTAVSSVVYPQIDLTEPLIALVASGGHSSIYKVHNFAKEVIELGSTLDDAAGEAFDKAGRLLGFPYPGGPEIDKRAKLSQTRSIEFPISFLKGPKFAAHRYDFSFSGVKSSLARYIEKNYPAGVESIPELELLDICASFSHAITEVLVQKTVLAAKDNDISRIFIGGGFSANSELRSKFEIAAQKNNLEVFIPPIQFCTDNGVMIAALGEILYQNKVPFSTLDFPISSTMQKTLFN